MGGDEGLGRHRLHYSDQFALKRRRNVELWLLDDHHEPVTPRHAKPTKSHKKDQCLHRYETTSMPPRWQRHGTRALEMRDYRFKNAVAVRGGHTQFQIGWPAEYRPNISIDLADEFGEVLVILKRRGRVSESLSFYKYCLRWATTSV